MSKDSSGESLEAILASIRRSLTEQATTALDDAAAVPAETPAAGPSDPPADLDAPPIPGSVSRQLAAALEAVQATATEAGAALGGDGVAQASARGPALTLVSSSPVPTASPGAAVGAPGAEASAASADDPAAPSAPAAAANLAAPADGSPAVEPRAQMLPAPASAAAAPAQRPASDAQEGPGDPLWFLAQGAGPRGAAGGAGTPQPPAPEPAAARAPEPKPSPLVAARGPLAPFFGSRAAEVVKVEMVPDRSVRGSAFPPAPVPPVAGHPPDGLHAGGDALGGLHLHQPSAGGAGGLRAASSIFGPPPEGEGRSGGPAGEAHPPQIQALEAMVAELLRPMLRRWLDENMPRLVSAALQAELMARRDPKKP